MLARLLLCSWLSVLPPFRSISLVLPATAWFLQLFACVDRARQRGAMAIQFGSKSRQTTLVAASGCREPIAAAEPAEPAEPDADGAAKKWGLVLQIVAMLSTVAAAAAPAAAAQHKGSVGKGRKRARAKAASTATSTAAAKSATEEQGSSEHLGGTAAVSPVKPDDKTLELPEGVCDSLALILEPEPPVEILMRNPAMT